MENNNQKPSEQDVQIYSGEKRPARARRDIGVSKEKTPEERAPLPEESVSDDKTRVDMPTLTGEIIAPVRRAKREVAGAEKKEAEAKAQPFAQSEKKSEEAQPSEQNELKSVFLEEDDGKTEESTGKNMFFAFGKSIGYLIFVVCASIIVAWFGITVVNDVFAFVKSDKDITITVSDDTTFRQLASDLEKEGAVQYPLFLRIYNSFKNRDNDEKQELEPGTYTLKTNLNYDELISLFVKKAAPREIVRITFPEGITIDEMIKLFVENGIGNEKDFVAAVSTSLIYDMDYKFLKELQSIEKEGGFKDGRKYVLEGYLYPDTYDFYTDTSALDAISKLLDTFNVRFESAYYERCNEMDMTVDEIITLASIVQKETKWDDEYERVSALYHNRLNNPSVYPLLQCDSTYLYAFPEKRGDGLTIPEMENSDNPYSTYSHNGLPPSAICNPSLNAIISAMYPTSPVDAYGRKIVEYFMVAKKDGYHLFATSKAQHDANKYTVDNEE